MRNLETKQTGKKGIKPALSEWICLVNLKKRP